MRTGDVLTTIVMDSCVLVDVTLKSRERHHEANVLALELVRRGTRICMPMHGFFEVSAALKQHKLSDPSHFKLSSSFSDDPPLTIDFVPINQEFVQRYLHQELPQVRAGDLIFLAVALVEGWDLVTEDDQLFQRAQEAGVGTFRIRDYLEALGVAV